MSDYIDCKCVRGCWKEFTVEVPDEVIQLFFEEKETEETTGNAQCPHCRMKGTLIEFADGDSTDPDRYVRGTWWPYGEEPPKVPRPWTKDEMVERFLRHVWSLVRYWEHEDRAPGVHSKLTGLTHSLLVLLDGESGFMPAHKVIPDPPLTDEADYRERGENWYPTDVDISGCLHERFYEFKPKKYETVDDASEVLEEAFRLLVGRSIEQVMGIKSGTPEHYVETERAIVRWVNKARRSLGKGGSDEDVRDM